LRLMSSLAGMSLLEGVIAMIILALALLSLAVPVFHGLRKRGKSAR